MTEFSNFDRGEIGKFDRIAQIWWDPGGAMGSLHTVNPLRLRFIAGGVSLRGLKALDVGCGGGILAEALARNGARVTGVDLSQASIEVATRHARTQGLAIDYRHASAEEIAKAQPGGFDVVTCMEMLEHVPESQEVVAACAHALRPGGHAFFSTINRTPKALLFAIVGGEYILRLLPRGSHTYGKLIRPAELKAWARRNGLELAGVASLMYNPFRRLFRVVPNKEDVNYMAHFVKRGFARPLS